MNLRRAWKKPDEAWLLPLSLTFTYVINIAFYYIGLCFQANPVREALFLVGCAGFALVSVLMMVQLLRSQRIPWRKLVLPGLVLVFFAAYLLYALISSAFHMQVVMTVGRFGLIAFPAFCCGVYGAIARTEASFFAKMETLAFFALPAGVIYMVGSLFNCNPYNYGRDLGILGYNNVAYT